MLRAIVRLSARAMTRALEWALPPQEDDEARLGRLVRSSASARPTSPTLTTTSAGTPTATPTSNTSNALVAAREPTPLAPPGLHPCPQCSTNQRPGAVHFAKPTDERPCPGSWRR